MVLDSLLIVSDLAQKLAINCLFVEVFVNEILGIIDSSCCLDFLEGKFNDFELIHLLLNFISQHLIDEDVCEEYLSPVLLVHILVLDSPLSDLIEISLSHLICV